MKMNRTKDKMAVNLNQRDDIQAWAKVLSNIAIIMKVMEEVLKLLVK